MSAAGARTRRVPTTSFSFPLCSVSSMTLTARHMHLVFGSPSPTAQHLQSLVSISWTNLAKCDTCCRTPVYNGCCTSFPLPLHSSLTLLARGSTHLCCPGSCRPRRTLMLVSCLSQPLPGDCSSGYNQDMPLVSVPAGSGRHSKTPASLEAIAVSVSTARCPASALMVPPAVI